MNKVVYGHYTKEGRLFYIGKGTLKRAYSRHSRSKKWNLLSNSGTDFEVEVLYGNLDDSSASYIEEYLIKAFKQKLGSLICNYCEGDMLESQWLLHAKKEEHPMYGKKNPKASQRMAAWNKERSGAKSPTYGIKRPDLIARNKSKTKPLRLVELNIEFPSGKDAAKYLGSTYFRAEVVDKPNRTFKGYHFQYV